MTTGSDIIKFGQIATLDDKIFAQENGVTGYWKPVTFLRDFGIVNDHKF